METLPQWLSGALAGGISGALVSAICSYLIVRYQQGRAEITAMVNDVCKDVRTMEELGVRYWQMEGDDPMDSNLAVRIKGMSKRIGTQASSCSLKKIGPFAMVV